MLLPANAAEGNPGLARDPIHASNSISVGPGCKEGGAPRALPPDGLTHLLESVTSHSRISAPMFGHTHTHTHTHTLRMWGGICLRELQTTHPSATRQEGSLAKNNTHARTQATNQPHGPRNNPLELRGLVSGGTGTDAFVPETHPAVEESRRARGDTAPSNRPPPTQTK